MRNVRPSTLTAIISSLLLALGLICSLALAQKTPELIYTLSDKGLSGPATVAGGYTWIHFKNTAKGPRTAQVLEVKPGTTLNQAVNDMNSIFKSNFQSQPKYVGAGIGGPAPTATGQSNSVGMTLKPGLYMVWTSSLESNSLRKADALMLRVTGSSGAVVPTPDYSVKLKKLRFAFSAPVKAGKHLFRVENADPMPHWMWVMALQPGKTFEQAQKEELKGNNLFNKGGYYGPVMGTFVIDSGYSNDVWLDLKPGEYMVICYVMDHQKAGMMYHLTVQP